MQFKAKCAGQVSKNGSAYVLLTFEPNSHLVGEIAKELGELQAGKTYRITIEEEE